MPNMKPNESNDYRKKMINFAFQDEMVDDEVGSYRETHFRPYRLVEQLISDYQNPTISCFGSEPFEIISDFLNSAQLAQIYTIIINKDIEEPIKPDAKYNPFRDGALAHKLFNSKLQTEDCAAVAKNLKLRSQDHPIARSLSSLKTEIELQIQVEQQKAAERQRQIAEQNAQRERAENEKQKVDVRGIFKDHHLPRIKQIQTSEELLKFANSLINATYWEVLFEDPSPIQNKFKLINTSIAFRQLFTKCPQHLQPVLFKLFPLQSLESFSTDQYIQHACPQFHEWLDALKNPSASSSKANSGNTRDAAASSSLQANLGNAHTAGRENPELDESAKLKDNNLITILEVLNKYKNSEPFVDAQFPAEKKEKLKEIVQELVKYAESDIQDFIVDKKTRTLNSNVNRILAAQMALMFTECSCERRYDVDSISKIFTDFHIEVLRVHFLDRYSLKNRGMNSKTLQAIFDEASQAFSPSPLLQVELALRTYIAHAPQRKLYFFEESRKLGRNVNMDLAENLLDNLRNIKSSEILKLGQLFSSDNINTMREDLVKNHRSTNWGHITSSELKKAIELAQKLFPVQEVKLDLPPNVKIA